MKKLIGLCALALTLSNCDTGKVSKSENNYQTIRLGVSDFVGFDGVGQIMYDGMNPRDSLFFMSNPGYNTTTSKTYPSSSKKVHFYMCDFDVLKVTSDSLVLGYQKK